MSTTDDLLRNAERYAETFEKGDLPLPPARKIAVVACMDARIIRSRILGLEEGDAGIKPPWAAESFPDLEEDVRQSIARIQASPFIPRKDSVRGFIYEVESGRLREVS